jgi:hypothetical protein
MSCQLSYISSVAPYVYVENTVVSVHPNFPVSLLGLFLGAYHMSHALQVIAGYVIKGETF